MASLVHAAPLTMMVYPACPDRAAHLESVHPARHDASSIPAILSLSHHKKRVTSIVTEVEKKTNEGETVLIIVVIRAV